MTFTLLFCTLTFYSIPWAVIVVIQGIVSILCWYLTVFILSLKEAVVNSVCLQAWASGQGSLYRGCRRMPSCCTTTDDRDTAIRTQWHPLVSTLSCHVIHVSFFGQSNEYKAFPRLIWMYKQYHRILSFYFNLQQSKVLFLCFQIWGMILFLFCQSVTVKSLKFAFNPWSLIMFHGSSPFWWHHH